MTKHDALTAVARPNKPSVSQVRRERIKAEARRESAQKANAARNAKLSPAERSAIARKAGLANADRLARLRALEDGLKLQQREAE